MKIRRLLTMAAVILAGFILQFCVFANISFIDTVPNIMLIITCSAGLLNGKTDGMVTGLFCGFLMDMGCQTAPGFYMIVLILCGYLTGFLNQVLYTDYIIFPMLVTALFDFMFGFYEYVFHFLIRGKLVLLFYLKRIILPEMIYTVVLTMVLFQVLAHIYTRLDAAEQRSADKFV